MKALLDTHAFLWTLTDDRRLSPRARRLIGDATNEVLLSAASVWELVLKAQAGKLDIEGNVSRFVADEVRRNSFRVLPVELRHVLRCGELPLHHRDPFDRLLVAQAQEEGVPLLTADKALKRYSVQIVW